MMKSTLIMTLLLLFVSSGAHAQPPSQDSSKIRPDFPLRSKAGASALTKLDEKVYPIMTGAATIPDNNSTGITKTVVIDDSIIAKEVMVCVDIDHSYTGDLIIKVKGPNGKTDTLWNKQGGSADDIKKCLGATAFQNTTIKGTWILRVADEAAENTGKLNSAEIRAKY